MKLKDTLNMPKTDFGMKAGLATKEPRYQKEWLDQDIYAQIIEKNKDAKPFVLLDGPPYANGEIHAGHGLNKILKDIVIRSKNMMGYKTEVILGWDTHGLPIENALTKNKKIKRNELTDSEFRDLCHEYANKQIDIQKEQFMSLGIMADPTQIYRTLDKSYEASQIEVFAKMVDRGLIYKGLKPVYWSPTSQSALAEAEIEYQDKKSAAIYVGFDIVDPNFENTQIVIWTTTPWTIPANYGVSVHPELEYSVISFNDKNYMVATGLVETFTKTLEVTEYQTVKTVMGSELERVKLQHPIFDRQSFIMLGDHVEASSGTGCVHTAPGHGEDDFLVGKKYDIEVVSYVDAFGKLNANALEFEGIFYDDANKLIVEKLSESGHLLNLTFIKHSYPHDWRTKKPVIFRATPQWFASIDPVKKDILAQISDVNWVNEWGRVRLHNMIEGRSEWCISRQRKWGVPIPIFYTQKEEPILDIDLINHVGKLFLEFGSNVWFEKTAKELLPEGYTHVDSPDGIFTKESDIMDVWFDSGCAHTAVGKTRLGAYPADLYLEGSDQYRGWFNSSLITGHIANGIAPYKSVLSHGFVLDKKGNKMSKSIGNTISPKQITTSKGADILRLWTASVDYQSDVRISDEVLGQVSELYRRFRNSIRFMLGNLAEFNKADLVDLSSLTSVDKYMMLRLNDVIDTVKKAYETYEFKKVVDTVNNYLTLDLSAFYLDYIKDVTYISSSQDVARRNILTVLYHHVDVLLKLMTPILPHTTYEAGLEFDGSNYLLADMPQAFDLTDPQLMLDVEAFLQVRREVNKAIELVRDEKVIGKSFEAIITINPTAETKVILDKFANLDLYFIVSKVVIDEKLSNGLETAVGTILVEKYSDFECNRCRKYFTESELSSYEFEDATEMLCSTCVATIGE